MTPVTVSERLSGNFATTFRALRHRDFRIFLTGYVISLIGTWMQSLAQAWLVYRLTRSGTMLGLTMFAQHIPVLLLGPIAGVVADRYPRYRILVIANALFLVQAIALALLTLTGVVAYPHVVALAAMWGVINAFEIPARQSLYVHMVGRDDLLNAIALNSVVFNAGRVVGPSIAGILVAAFGEGPCFLLNSATFVVVLISLSMVHVRHQPPPPAHSALSHLADGFRYMWNHRPLRSLLSLTSMVNISGAPALVLAPLFADAIFQRGARGLGFLSGTMGAGAILGTLALARRTGTAGLPKTVVLSCLLMGAGLAIFAGSPMFAISLAGVALIGFNVMRQNASSNTLIQSLVPDDYRGRAMAMYSMTVVGMLPVGSLAAGALSDMVGPRLAVFSGALLCTTAALVFRRRILSIEAT